MLIKIRALLAMLTPTQSVACLLVLPLTTIGALLLAWAFIHYNKRRRA